MKLTVTATAFTLIALAANAATPPPAQPQGPLPFGARQLMVLEFQDSLSQAIGAEVNVTSARSYKEQDGSATMCVVARAAGHRIRLISNNAPSPMLQPTQAQWIDAGCARPGYLLLR